MSLVQPRSLLTSVSDDCGLPSLSSVVHTKGELNSDATNSCLGLFLVEPMSLLDSVSDDCVINITKALSLLCVYSFAFVMTCAWLCCFGFTICNLGFVVSGLMVCVSF